MNKFVIAVSCLILFGCATGGGTGPGAAGRDQMDAKFKTAMARESSGLKAMQSSGDLKMTVLAKGTPHTKRLQGSDKKQYELHIPIGASQTMECYLTEGLSSPAVVLKTIFDSIPNVPQIASVQIKTINADVLKNMGYIYLEAEYLTKEKKYGTAKILAASSMNISFYCTHDELGYRKTFLKVADSIVKSSYIQKFMNDFSGYDKKQIDIISVQDMSVGYAEHYQFPDDKNTLRDLEFSSFVVPRTAKEIMAIDSIEKMVYGKASGDMLAGEYFSYENNEEEYQISFEHLTGTQYRAQGTLKGQKFSQSFETERPLMNSDFLLEQYSTGKTSKKEQTFEEYSTLSPSKPVKSRIVLTETRPDGIKKIDYSFHTAKASLELDTKGYRLISVNMANTSMLIQRKYFDAPR